MSTEVNKAFVNKYRSNFIHLAQQKGSRLRNFVRVNEGVVGKADHFDRLGSTNAQKMTSRHADTPLISTPHSRRKVVMEDYNWADQKIGPFTWQHVSKNSVNSGNLSTGYAVDNPEPSLPMVGRCNDHPGREYITSVMEARSNLNG